MLTSKPTGKRPLGRPRLIWEDNIRMDLKEIVIIQGIGLIWLRIGMIGSTDLRGIANASRLLLSLK